MYVHYPSEQVANRFSRLAFCVEIATGLLKVLTGATSPFEPDSAPVKSLNNHSLLKLKRQVASFLEILEPTLDYAIYVGDCFLAIFGKFLL